MDARAPVTRKSVFSAREQRVASPSPDTPDSLRAWVEGPLKQPVPHAALLCGQYEAHAAGYTGIARWSFGLPEKYLERISSAGLNIRSPVLKRLMQGDGSPVFFDAARDGSDYDATWVAQFRRTGWHNVLGMIWRAGQGDEERVSVAAFYDVPSMLEPRALALQRAVMPTLHTVMSEEVASARRGDIDPQGQVRLDL